VIEADVLAAFREAMTARDLVPPADIIADGRLHRCDTRGRHGEGDGSYLLHLDDYPAGGYCNWQDGLGWQSWTYRHNTTKLTPAEREVLRVKFESDKRVAEDEPAPKVRGALAGRRIVATCSPC
jgi:putative DNA primase/helicase